MELGPEVRKARLRAQLTQAEVAARAGLTPAHLSLIERGRANPSIGALNRICQAVSIRMGDLFFPEGVASHRDETHPSLPIAVVRHNRRPTFIPPGSTIRHELLSPDLQHRMEIFKTYVPAGVDLGDTPVSHAGEECIFVIAGALQLTHGQQSYVLESGDSAYFDASIPHHWANIGPSQVELIWIATPPHF